jgi:chemotaxis family two-component system response regulator Rcp1
VILLVEDNRADVFLIQEAIQVAGIQAEIEVLADGEGAIQYFERMDVDASMTCPAIMILDINLPKRPGNEVLAHMRRTNRCRETAVVVVTSSDSDRDREEMARLGIKEYFRKPSDFASFMKLGDILKDLLTPRA